MGAQGHRPATILVVDDLVENIELLGQLLSMQGYEVQSAVTGEEAVACCLSSPPDLMLLDLVLPEMNGFEVCERLKADPATRHIPIIIVTGNAEHDSSVRALEAGADDLLTKPVDAALLEARIRNCLRAKRLQDELLDHHRHLEVRIRERTTQLERRQHVTVFSLAKLAESRDTDTGEHINRVRTYAQELALLLAASVGDPALSADGFARRIYHSTPLHDIGKVGIPDAILLKPGKLTPDEFEIMKTHSTIGGDTLRAADAEAGGDPFLSMGCDIAYHHHERWDGTGYPHGLAGDAIPLAARIVALADTYDALRSKRPYKEGYPHQQAREIVLAGRGVHFDPAVVDAFLLCEKRFDDINQVLRDAGGPSMLQRLATALPGA